MFVDLWFEKNSTIVLLKVRVKFIYAYATKHIEIILFVKKSLSHHFI